MKTFEDALAFAALCHAGQTDKAGAPYILHPLRVMLSLGDDASSEERCAALFHDVVEDCGVKLDDLRAKGYSEAVVQAVDALTKRAEEKGDYMASIRRLSTDPIARKVKIADLSDNMNLSRLGVVTAKDEERAQKYRAARDFLQAL